MLVKWQNQRETSLLVTRIAACQPLFGPFELREPGLLPSYQDLWV